MSRQKKVTTRKNFSSEDDTRRVGTLNPKPTVGEPKRYNSWYGLIFSLDSEERQGWVDLVIADMEKKAKRENNKGLAEVVSFLRNESVCQIIGFTPGFEYLMSGNHDNRDDWDKSYIHAAGAAMLFVKHKKLPVYMMISPEAKWGESDLPVEGVIGGTG